MDMEAKIHNGNLSNAAEQSLYQWQVAQTDKPGIILNPTLIQGGDVAWTKSSRARTKVNVELLPFKTWEA